MRFLRGLCRIIFSLTFIFSGIFKLIDPVGTGLKITEYLSFMHLGFLDPCATAIGIILATLEFVTGICVLIGLKMHFFSSVALCLTGFFTLITLYLALFNPISDCGCFGEAIHLTNWETFQKNIVLLALILFIHSGRHKATVIATNFWQWTFVGMFTLLGLGISIHALMYLPQIDFTAYNIGQDLSEEAEADKSAQFETIFIYSKDGTKEEFTLDNLPDSTWNFEESVTRQTGGSVKYAQIDFELEHKEGPFFVITVYNPEKLSPELRNKLVILKQKAESRGAVVEIMEDADRKTMMTMNRSNGGVTYFNDGVIVKKWSRLELDNIDPYKILEEDSDVLVLQSRIHEQVYISIIIVSILFIILLVRYICRLIYKNRKQ